MKIEGYEEITKEEAHKLKSNEFIFVRNENDDAKYFKKVQELPIVFEDNARIIKLDNNETKIINKYNDESICFNIKVSEPLLIKALEKLKEVRK